MTAKRLTVRSAIAAIFLTGAVVAAPAPALSGEAEMALLSSYVGDWAGESVLRAARQDEPFRCRLKVSKGNQAKINYSGRCTLVNSTSRSPAPSPSTTERALPGGDELECRLHRPGRRPKSGRPDQLRS